MTTPTTEPTTAQVDAALIYADHMAQFRRDEHKNEHVPIFGAEVRRLQKFADKLAAELEHAHETAEKESAMDAELAMERADRLRADDDISQVRGGSNAPHTYVDRPQVPDVAELMRDKARLDWLENNPSGATVWCPTSDAQDYGVILAKLRTENHDAGPFNHATFRAAIDAAMEGGK